MSLDCLPPIREELFSVGRLEEHGRSLAEAQTVTPKLIRGHPLADRLADNGAVLLAAYRLLVTTISAGAAITPAAEWLIDNYHLVERQISDIRAQLPPGFYRQLPKLAVGPFAGYPRVFGIAWGFVAHTDSRFDSLMLRRYVLAYQQVQPLTIGELWALGITLKVVLIENLRRLADAIMRNRLARQQADGLADRLLGAAEPLPVVLADQKRRPFSDPFAVQLLHRLRDQDPRITPALTMLDERLAAQGTNAEAVVRDVHRQQGASTVTVRNIITSLRLISDVDWTEFFEGISLVNEVLAGAPGFSDMDFPTRNLYRTAVEDLALGARRGEIEVAQLAVRAAAAMSAESDPRQADPGYHLLSAGREAFEATLGYRVPVRVRLRRLVGTPGIGGFGLAIMLTTGCLLALPLTILFMGGLGGWGLGLLAGLGLIPAIDAAVALVNRAVTAGFHATLLPAMELRDGVPASLRTVVAVPTLLTSKEGIDQQVESLEVHHLASLGGHLHFALLSDWTDAVTEQVDGDQALLVAAIHGIDRLNARYGPAPGGRPRFLLLHRRRQWNPGEGRWIGWERKRGKLHELNRLLRGATDTSFIGGMVPSDVRYVVTLDSDSRLPRDTVRRLIGKMAHPLNHPRFDSAGGRVIDGYAVLQPRVTPSLPIGTEGSLFQRIFSSLSGIDPYASAVSDVYQDLFGEGSYAGKGIYDVDAFEAALAGRVPECSLLSHDLFEGVFARAGLATDVEVIEEFPARYDVCSLRSHRWARGDWQLLPWIFGRGAGRAGGGVPAIGRWKMVDNLRRTLSAPTAIMALAAGVALPLDQALIWTAFILSTIILPTLIPVVAAIAPCRREVSLISHLRALAADLGLAASLSGLIITFLAHTAWVMGDAIIRTVWRLFVSRIHLLEWVPAAQAANGARLGPAGFTRRMVGGMVLGVPAVAVALIAAQPGSWIVALAFAALWAIAPAVAWWASRSPAVAGRIPVTAADRAILRLTARRTWRYFETTVTALDHMLPPDNFQEDPVPVLAHRTSPTNIGLYLLSVVSARDFGWIGTDEAMDRIEATLATMAGLERFNGHFYNWYDTRDLRVLEPKYVSSVDSGNLAGHLIALANACREWQGRERGTQEVLAGLLDAIALTRDEVAHLRDGRQTQTVTLGQLDDALAALAALAGQTPIGPEPVARLWSELAASAEIMVDIARALAMERDDPSAGDMLFWAGACVASIASQRRDLGQNLAVARNNRAEAIAGTARGLAVGMQFAFLLDRERMLLSIGYLPAEASQDGNCYDLLASEARLASFFAIAKGDIPARHWFRLGRSVTPVAHRAALISWSGSMFEYLMPSLVMRAPAGSLIEQTARLAVRRQIDYADGLALPWGISESAFNARDLELTYQYSNFGVPGLGLKRGLGENLVIAPYATALATMVDPAAAAANLTRLAAAGGRGRHGFYEALDYTPARVPAGQTVTIVRAFMAHHQGMTIVAIANALFDGVMRARFHADPMIQATELLLQERVPRDMSVAHAWAAEVQSDTRADGVEPSGGRRFSSANQATPAVLLLSNGRFATMLTTAGSGYSRWGNMAVTRWREDSTCDDSGSAIFLCDTQSGAFWSAGLQPTAIEPDEYHVAFNEDRAEFTRRDGTLTTSMEVLVSPEDDAEVRRVSISNSGPLSRVIEVTSYAELVLTTQGNDIAHPAFYKLFVETELLPDQGAIVATRRRRSASEPEVWAAHLSVVDGEVIGPLEIETDRSRFLGRSRGVRSPLAMVDGRPLSGTVGAVLDPVFALRRRVRVAPGAVVRIAFWTMLASTRTGLLDSIDRHRNATAFARAATLAWTQAQVQLHHLGISAGESAVFQRLAGHVIHATPLVRPISDTISRGAGPQSGLWGLGISGDLPIVFLRIADLEYLQIVHELLQAHEYWRLKCLAVDLVILNEHQSSYVQDLHVALETLVRTSQSRAAGGGDGPQGRVFLLRAALVPDEVQHLLAAVARIVLVAHRGTLSEQLNWGGRLAGAQDLPAARRPGRKSPSTPLPPPLPLEFFNGLGGFAEDGREYVTILGPGQATPAPWVNVVANPEFGFQVPTEGGGFTWSVNSHENQITPWSNDPVSDRSGEAFYLYDRDVRAVWSPTALPIRDEAATYVARHGWGYSRFEHTAHGIASDLVQFVPMNGSVKISRLVLRNRSGRVRHLSATAYVEWILGAARALSCPFLITGIDGKTGAMFARNPWNAAFGSRVAFLDLGGRQTDWTGDRREFIGRNGSLASPLALAGARAGVGAGRLSNRVGAGLDPCGVMRTAFTLPADGEIEIVCFLGQAASDDEAQSLIAHYRAADLDAVFAEVRSHWTGVLGRVAVKTPDRSMDLMLNGWLLYQTLVCRFWARSGFYQGSGAYGFRDQLQDGMALVGCRPDLTRAHLLRAASRQFIEGDVQHWWLPHSGQGVRTRISDDRVWLGHAVAHYVDATGDKAVLDQSVPFLEGEKLAEGEHDSFYLPRRSDQAASLFEHCARGLDLGLSLGSHGLPLMGTGDWNDGMNRVGEGGQGESVWLGWLLYATLMAFVPLAQARGQDVRAARWKAHTVALQAALEGAGWDGAWYRRGYFDDGTPLGSATSQECRIDAIAQSWAVLSGAADPERARQAMAAVERDLIRPQDGVALLFAPPFDKTTLEPGYVKGYPPGIRENGGQYTHAALWSVMAFAAQGQGDKAGALFSMLNPINHAKTRSALLRYKVEPYVVAADIYARPPHVGRGGWTWYTGSAGWMQRAGIESILGACLHGDILRFGPCIPKGWGGFELVLNFGAARIEIAVENPSGVESGITYATFDSTVVEQRPLYISLIDDGMTHYLHVIMG
ncbi:MAG: glycosyl transferase [Alphaproteobacteria bacterium]|nr:glycosyl transferase [Alphaproteobacteria bacterium]